MYHCFNGFGGHEIKQTRATNHEIGKYWNRRRDVNPPKSALPTTGRWMYSRWRYFVYNFRTLCSSCPRQKREISSRNNVTAH